MKTTKLLGALLSAALAAAACGAGGDDDPMRKGRTGTGGEAPASPEVEAAAAQPLPEGASLAEPRLRRLTRAELESAARDVFALGADWAGVDLGADRASELGFDNDAHLLDVDEAKAGELGTAAESIADAVVTRKISVVPACAGVDGRACAMGVLDGPAARLFRRTLEADERARYVALYDATLAGGAAPRDGAKWLLAAVLASPSFIYRSELGTRASNGRHVLSGEELATELSFTFGGGLPDAELLAKGRAGTLAASEARVAEAKALLATPRGHEVLGRFARQWLRYADVVGIVKDEAAAPGFARLREDMAEETRRFFDDLVFAKRGGVGALFAGPRAFASPALAAHYGAEDPGIGLLAHGSLLSRYGLAASSSPSQRGAFVRRRLLCQPLPPPPPNVGEPPIPRPGVTTRELYEKAHAAAPSCAGCHQVIDPIGFGFEHFDVAGKPRKTEQGKPIDASGKLTGVAGAARPFADHKELASVLGSLPEVADCLGGLLAAYTLGDASARAYTHPDARARLRSGGLSLIDYVAEIAAAPTFTLRADPTK